MRTKAWILGKIKENTICKAYRAAFQTFKTPGYDFIYIKFTTRSINERI